MIINNDKKIILDGKYGNGSFWRYDIPAKQMNVMPFTKAGSVKMFLGKNDYFISLPKHRDPGPHSQIIVSHFSNPARAISWIHYETENNTRIEGDLSVWTHVPKAILVDSLNIVRVFPETGSFQNKSMHWFLGPEYDRDYQAIHNVEEMPGSNLLVFSIIRNSRLVIYDPDKNQVVSYFVPSKGALCPDIHFLRSENEAWVSDQDSLYRILLPDWIVRDRIRIRPTFAHNTTAFNIGAFCFSPDESIVMVTRPHQNDVLGIDANSCRLTMQAKIASIGHPSEIVAVDSRNFVVLTAGEQFLQGTLGKFTGL